MKKLTLRTILLIIPLIFFAIFASILYFDRTQNYTYYERIKFESAGATLYANFYHPNKQLQFQDKHPLIIYAHGHGWQKDVDIRSVIELTKRGFFVAALDYQGHGESGGALDNVDAGGVPGIAQDCINLLDRIEKLDVYNEKINASQIGLLGHSLGGMIVLMNGARDSRFSATVSWAGVVNASLFEWNVGDYNPVNLINNTNPQNLLIIHSQSDAVVDYEKHALAAQDLTGCPVINITDSLISAHFLISDKVLSETINWYELKFFGSEILNGEINFSWTLMFLFMLLTLMSMCFLVFSIIIVSSSYILKNQERKKTELNINDKNISSTKYALSFLLALVLYVGLWFGMIQIFNLSSIYIVPLVIIVGYLLFRLIDFFVIKKKKLEFSSIKSFIKKQINPWFFLYSFTSSVIFLGGYYIISLTYPWSLFYPPSIFAFLGSFIIFPLYLSSEIFYRKILYPLSNFTRNRKARTLLIAFIILIFHIYLVYISFIYSEGPALIASFSALLMSSAMNCIIYHKTKNFSATLLNSIIINGMFFGSTVPVLVSLFLIIF